MAEGPNNMEWSLEWQTNKSQLVFTVFAFFAVYGEQVVSGVVCGGDITIHCVWRSDNLSSFNVASHQNWVIVIGNNLIGSAHDSQH